MRWMRGLIMVLLFVLPVGCSGRKDMVHWVSLEQGLSLQESSNRPILFYFYSKSCMYCKLMRMNTFSDSKVANKVNSMFVPVKLDIEEDCDGDMPSGSKLASAFHIRAVPALVVVDTTHRMLDSRMGFLTVRKTLAFVSAIAASKGKSVLKKEAKRE